MNCARDPGFFITLKEQIKREFYAAMTNLSSFFGLIYESHFLQKYSSVEDSFRARPENSLPYFPTNTHSKLASG